CASPDRVLARSSDTEMLRALRPTLLVRRPLSSALHAPWDRGLIGVVGRLFVREASRASVVVSAREKVRFFVSPRAFSLVSEATRAAALFEREELLTEEVRHLTAASYRRRVEIEEELTEIRRLLEVLGLRNNKLN